jgi:protein-S-isoprenylcysteine O-methyltransferase Ste14
MVLIPDFEIGIWNAWIFMSIFIIQMLVIMFVNRKAWDKSHVPAQAKRNRYEKNIGIFANIFWLIAMIYSIFLPLALKSYWFYFGFSLFVIGVLILGRATYDFITTSSNKVIKTGVYKISRHPMYLSTFIITLSVSIASISWLFFILSVIMMFFFHKEALIEERFCLKIYGKEYNNYLNQTPRWIGLSKPGKNQ